MQLESPMNRSVETVRLVGRIHAGNVKDTMRAVRATAGSQVIFDMSETIAIDSTALGEIVRIHRKLLASGGEAVFASPSTGIRRVLGITRLDTIFRIVEGATPASEPQS